MHKELYRHFHGSYSHGNPIIKSARFYLIMWTMQKAELATEAPSLEFCYLMNYNVQVVTKFY